MDKNRPAGEHNLVEWAKPYLTNKRKVLRIIDTRLEGQHTQAEALKASNLALHCICVDPKFRPTMNEVVASLEQLQDSKGHTKTNQNDRNPNHRHTHSSDDNRHHRRRGADEASTRKVTSYPKPALNPLST